MSQCDISFKIYYFKQSLLKSKIIHSSDNQPSKLQITSQGFLNNITGEGNVKDLKTFIALFQFQPASQGLMQETKENDIKMFSSVGENN